MCRELRPDEVPEPDVQLAGRHVHRDPHLRVPFPERPEVGAGLSDDPPAELQDRSVPLGLGYELRRRDQLAVRSDGPDQRLGAHDPPGRELDDRLVVKDEASSGEVGPWRGIGRPHGCRIGSRTARVEEWSIHRTDVRVSNPAHTADRQRVNDQPRPSPSPPAEGAPPVTTLAPDERLAPEDRTPPITELLGSGDRPRRLRPPPDGRLAAVHPAPR